MSEEIIKMWLWLASVIHEYNDCGDMGCPIASDIFDVGNLRISIKVETK